MSGALYLGGDMTGSRLRGWCTVASDHLRCRRTPSIFGRGGGSYTQAIIILGLNCLMSVTD